MRELDPTTYRINWDEVRELRRAIELDGLPDDPTDIRCRFVHMVRNAEGLCVAFGGQWDEGARRECAALAQTIWQIDHWSKTPTHVGSAQLN